MWLEELGTIIGLEQLLEESEGALAAAAFTLSVVNGTLLLELQSAGFDGVDGLVAKAGDPIDLARKMEQLHNDKNLQTTLVGNGRNSVRNSYNWDVVGNQFENLYFSIIKHNRQ